MCGFQALLGDRKLKTNLDFKVVELRTTTEVRVSFFNGRVRPDYEFLVKKIVVTMRVIPSNQIYELELDIPVT